MFMFLHHLSAHLRKMAAGALSLLSAACCPAVVQPGLHETKKEGAMQICISFSGQHACCVVQC